MPKRVQRRSINLVLAGFIAITISIAGIFIAKVVRIQSRPYLLTLLRKDGRFKTFERIYDNSLFPTYKNAHGSWTLLAPLDSGFEKVGKSEIDLALKDKNLATAIVARHLLPGVFPSERLRSLAILENVRKYFLHFRVDNAGRIHVDDATIVEPDLMASDGIIHVLDRPLRPER